MLNDDSVCFTRAQIAKRYDINPETLRVYENYGLINPQRDANNYRLYRQNEVDRIDFTMNAKSLGFSLVEIKDLLTLTFEQHNDVVCVLESINDKVNVINHKIISLKKMKKSLQDMQRLCKTPGVTTGKHCPILNGFKAADAS